VYFVPPPTLTMMHLCITQCTYWTSLFTAVFKYIMCCSADLSNCWWLHDYDVVAYSETSVSQHSSVAEFCQ